MQRTNAADNREVALGGSRLPVLRQAPPPPVERSRWFRWIYAARPSLMPTVFVPNPMLAARRV
jgi:hypothetical protein